MDDTSFKHRISRPVTLMRCCWSLAATRSEEMELAAAADRAPIRHR